MARMRLRGQVRAPVMKLNEQMFRLDVKIHLLIVRTQHLTAKDFATNFGYSNEKHTRSLGLLITYPSS